MVRAPLTPDALVRTSRALLVEGGPEAVVVREVARRLGVTAPALYRHVRGRDDLLTLLIAACTDEVTGVCAAARRRAARPRTSRAGCGRRPGRSGPGRWRTRRSSAWSTAPRSPRYAAPEDGPTVARHAALRRCSSAGSSPTCCAAGGCGPCRTTSSSPRLRDAAGRAAAAAMGLPMRPGELHPFVVGWHRMLGIVSVEVAGHLRWAFEDDRPLRPRQLDELAADLLRARLTGPRDCRPRVATSAARRGSARWWRGSAPRA